MSSIFLIISAILPIVTNVLQSYKTISPGLASLITGIEGAAQALVTELTNPATGQLSVTASSLLSAIAAALSILQTQKVLTPTDSLIATAFVSAAQAGLAASSVTVVDPAALKPIAAV